MKKFKIVSQLFTKAGAQQAAGYQREILRKAKTSFRKVEVVNAFEFCNNNKWVKETHPELKRPVEGQYMIIIYYAGVVEIVENTQPIETNIIKEKLEMWKAVINKAKDTVRKQFKIVGTIKKVIKAAPRMISLGTWIHNSSMAALSENKIPSARRIGSMTRLAA